MNKSKKLIPLVVWASFLSVFQTVWAEELQLFQNGEVANAEDINHNFSHLDDRIQALQQDPSERENQFNLKYISVDCSANPQALRDAYNDTLHLDRLSFRVEGTCEIDSLGISGRYINIAGAVTPDGQLCESPLPVLTSVGVDASPITILVNMGGVANLSCLVLGSEEVLAGSAYIGAFANSVIRFDRTVNSPNDALLVEVRNGSIFRYLGYDDSQGFSGQLALRYASAELLGRSHNISPLSLLDHASLNCYYCGGIISDAVVRGLSTVTARSNGSLLLSNISIEQNSYLYTHAYDGPDSLTVENVTEFSDPLRQTYTPPFGEKADKINPENHGEVTISPRSEPYGFNDLTRATESEAR